MAVRKASSRTAESRKTVSAETKNKQTYPPDSRPHHKSADKFTVKSLTTTLKIIVILALLIGAGVYYGIHKYQTRPMQSVFPELFTENIEYRFRSYAIKVTGKQSLYVAKLQQQEKIERTSYASLLWFQLPPMIVRVDVPVEYNYFVNLSGGWRFNVQADTLVVSIPELGSSTPAIDIANLKMVIAEGGLLRNEKKALEKMTKELPGLLIDRAIANREVVRDQARKSVEQFVRTWLSSTLNEPFDRPIRIEFPHDSIPQSNIPQ